ncbi:MAG TPA: accessory Sec system translocase SecA2 [Thermoanaerobaculia bacterium]
MLAALKRAIKELFAPMIGAPDSSTIDAVLEPRPEIRTMSEQELRDAAVALRDRARAGAAVEDLVVDTFGIAREGSRRLLRLDPFDVQMAGAVRLYEGHIIEMATGEGKTLVATFPVIANALAGEGVHVLTVNDYLAGRDAAWMRPLYELFGLTVASIHQRHVKDERRRAYAADVTYVTANEAGFDYLRDHLVFSPSDLVQRKFHFAVIDEVDSILIDEARIPLVIAGGVRSSGAQAQRAAGIVRQLVRDRDYAFDENRRNVALTDAGVARAEAMLGISNLYDSSADELHSLINVALFAEALLHRDADYIVKDGKIQLVDEFKGRIADRRRWPDGIHTALEAKENLALTNEGKILGSLTIRALMALYPRICGMTGTAATAAQELSATYGKRVAVIEPNRPSIRIDHPDAVFPDQEKKWRAVTSKIAELHAVGRPVLVGTRTVEESEQLAARLHAENIECNVLNARNDEAEAAIIAEAGDIGAVTISTNMAGRGTDIRLGGTSEARADEVRALGGLFVIGTNRHESRRIDWQLRGRAGRQGDPGETQFFVSLEDDLVVRYGLSELIRANDAQAEEIERAQRIIEGQNFDIRSNLLRYDLLLDRQRGIVYAKREEILFDEQEGILATADETRDRWEELAARYGLPLLRDVERTLTLALLDLLWSEHLFEVAEVREGIHLRSMAGNAYQEFNLFIFNRFENLFETLDARVIQTFLTAHIDEKGIDLEAAGLAAPASTWTYLVTDNPFGTSMERLLRGLRDRVVATYRALTR